MKNNKHQRRRRKHHNSCNNNSENQKHVNIHDSKELIMNVNNKDVNELSFSVDQDVRFTQVPGKLFRCNRYHGDLPDELQVHYEYLLDAGHSIVCVLEKHIEEALAEGMSLYQVPVPVKYVLEHGYRVEQGYIIVDAPYDDFLGLVVDEKYTEY